MSFGVIMQTSYHFYHYLYHLYHCFYCFCCKHWACLQDRSATVERVVCKVLLGQPESALEALSLAESTPASSQRSVH